MKKSNRLFSKFFIIVVLLSLSLAAFTNNGRAKQNEDDIFTFSFQSSTGSSNWLTNTSSSNIFSSGSATPLGTLFENIFTNLICPYIPGASIGSWLTCPSTPPTPTPPTPSPGQEIEVFSKQYEISKGKYGFMWGWCWGQDCDTDSMSATDNFSVSEKGIYYLRVYNGGLSSNKDNRVTSGEIKINNKAVIKSKDFDKNETFIEVQLDLKKGNNTIDVKINGKQGAYIVVKIVKISEPVPSEVIFQDANLEEAVRSALGLGATDRLTEERVLDLTDLYADSRGIEKLGGLEYCTNLEFLSLSGNHIDDVSPLSSLTHLIWLHLARNDIDDINDLESLYALEWVNLSDNKITIIDALFNLYNLEWVNLSNNDIHEDDLHDLSFVDYVCFHNSPYIYDRTSGMIAIDSDKDDLEFLFENLLANPVGDATLTVRVAGDLDKSNEYIKVKAGKTKLGDLFKAGNLKGCDGFNEDHMVISKNDLLSMIDNGTITFTLELSGKVDLKECDVRAYLRLEYESETPVICYSFGQETDTAISDKDDLSFCYKDIPANPLRDCILTVNVDGDLGSSNEYIKVKVGKTKLGDLYKSGTFADCSGFNEDHIAISKNQLQLLTTDGTITFTLELSGKVDFKECDVMAYLILAYEGEPPVKTFVFGQETDTAMSEGSLTFYYKDIPAHPMHDAVLTVNADGDLYSSNEYITVKSGSTNLGDLFKSGALADCSGFNEGHIAISKNQLQSLTNDGKIAFTLIPSGAVDFNECDLSAYVKLEYKKYIFGEGTDPVTSAGELSFTYKNIPSEPIRDCILTVNADGDLYSSNEYITVKSGSTNLGDLYKSGALADCSGFNEGQIPISKQQLKSLTTDGEVTFTLVPSDAVGYAGCDQITAYLKLEYEGEPLPQTYVLDETTDVVTSDGEISFTYRDIPSEPIHDCILTVNVDGDLYNSNEYITVKSGGTNLGDLYKSGALSDCSGFNEGQIPISKQKLKSLTTAGEVTFTLVPSGAVDFTNCDLSAYVKLEYISYVFGEETETVTADGEIPFTYRDIPLEPIRDCILTVNVDGDLHGSNEYITVKSGSTDLGDLYKSGALEDCTGFNEGQIPISKQELKSLTIDGEISFTLVPSGAVDFNVCDLTASLFLAYEDEPGVKTYVLDETTDVVSSDGEITFTYRDIPSEPIGDCILTVNVDGDLYESNEYITVKSGSASLGDLYKSGARTDCTGFNEDQIIISKNELQSLTTNGKISFTLVPSDAVGYAGCDVITAFLRLAYESEPAAAETYVFDETTDVITSDGEISFTYRDIPSEPIHDCILTVKVAGDLHSSSEYITVKSGSTNLGDLYKSGALSDCSGFNEGQIPISKQELKSLTTDGEITFTLVPSGGVDYNVCDLSAYLRLEYKSSLFGEQTDIVSSDGEISFIYKDIPSEPIRDCILTVYVDGDLYGSSEYITVKGRSISLGDLYKSGALSDCSGFNEGQIKISKSKLQSLTTDGKITFTLIPSDAVGYTGCDLITAYLLLAYEDVSP
ncbi:MAG: leucine-rich repeat domain-containing protein [bacterium]